MRKLRIRHKPWARGELEQCGFFVADAVSCKGKWKSMFENPDAPFQIELGCGKGGFMSELAARNPGINYLAVDMKDDMLGLAKRKIVKSYTEKNMLSDGKVKNVLLTPYDIERIDSVLDENDTASRIYINFCNPWPRKKQNKKRLTHTRQLLKYRNFLETGGEIRFKTDDDELFKDSIGYFKESGFEIKFLTYDLHGENIADNIVTEHENMFSEQGIKIKYLIAVKIQKD